MGQFGSLCANLGHFVAHVGPTWRHLGRILGHSNEETNKKKNKNRKNYKNRRKGGSFQCREGGGVNPSPWGYRIEDMRKKRLHWKMGSVKPPVAQGLVGLAIILFCFPKDFITPNHSRGLNIPVLNYLRYCTIPEGIQVRRC